MRTGALVVVLALWAAPVLAGEVPADVQVRLQNAMQRHLEVISKDGGYTYVTPASEKRTLFQANTHPMVLAYGSDYFVCSDMVDGNGMSHPADFLVREVDGDYRVVQMLVDQRPVVEAAMAKIKP